MTEDKGTCGWLRFLTSCRPSNIQGKLHVPQTPFRAYQQGSDRILHVGTDQVHANIGLERVPCVHLPLSSMCKCNGHIIHP